MVKKGIPNKSRRGNGLSKEKIRKKFEKRFKKRTHNPDNPIQKEFFYKKLQNIDMAALGALDLGSMKKMMRMLKNGDVTESIVKYNKMINKSKKKQLMDIMTVENNTVKLNCSKADASCFLITMPDIYWSNYSDALYSGDIVSLFTTLQTDYTAHKVSVQYFNSVVGVQEIPVTFGIGGTASSLLGGFGLYLTTGLHTYTPDDVANDFRCLVMHTTKGGPFASDLSNVKFTTHTLPVSLTPNVVSPTTLIPDGKFQINMDWISITQPMNAFCLGDDLTVFNDDTLLANAIYFKYSSADKIYSATVSGATWTFAFTDDGNGGFTVVDEGNNTGTCVMLEAGSTFTHKLEQDQHATFSSGWNPLDVKFEVSGDDNETLTIYNYLYDNTYNSGALYTYTWSDDYEAYMDGLFGIGFYSSNPFNSDDPDNVVTFSDESGNSGLLSDIHSN